MAGRAFAPESDSRKRQPALHFAIDCCITTTMFDLQASWWEFIVRATVVYLVLLVMVRVTGKRAVGQFTPFDLVVVMLLAEGVSGSLTAQDDSLPGGLIVAATLMVLDVVISYATARS